MQFVTINGVTLHYQTIGEPSDKPTILFSNSLGTDFRIWRDLIVRLVGDFSIVTYDKRGHGLSEAPDAPYAMDDHVGDAAGLLDHLNIRNAIVCGLSVGGAIAQGLALSRPDLVRALILCDTGHKIGTEELWDQRIEAVGEKGISAISDNILERWFSKAYRQPDNPFFHGYRNMLERTPLQGYLGTCHALRNSDFTETVSGIGVPTLCVVGEEDGSTPPQLVKALSQLIPNAQYEEIANAGHLPCIEQPEALHEVMRKFLQTVLTDG